MFCSTAKSEYIDIGYNKELTINALLKIESVLYAKVGFTETTHFYGLGAGYKFNSYELALTLNKADINYKTELELNYYDVHYNFFGAVSSDNAGTIGCKIGIGYGINEHLSVITHYSQNGAFIGIRKHL